MLTALTSGVEQMQAGGCKFTEDQIETLTQGEQTEQETLYKSYLGGAQVHNALNAIFNDDEGELITEVVH